MKYITPVYEKAEIEVVDIIATSGNEVMKSENSTGGVNFNMDFTTLFI